MRTSIKEIGVLWPWPVLGLRVPWVCSFPFGGRKTTWKTPVSTTLTTSPSSGHIVSSVRTQSSPGSFVWSIRSQTVAAKSRSLGTQTLPASTPDAPRRPVREHRPPSTHKEFEFYNIWVGNDKSLEGQGLQVDRWTTMVFWGGRRKFGGGQFGEGRGDNFLDSWTTLEMTTLFA